MGILLAYITDLLPATSGICGLSVFIPSFNFILDNLRRNSMSLTEESDAAFAEFLRNEPSLMSNKEKRERYIEETIEKAMIEGRDDRNKELERLERLTKEDQMAENKEPFKPKRLKKQSPAFYQLNDEFIAFHQGPNGYKGGALAGRELKEDDLLGRFRRTEIQLIYPERVLSFLHRKVELSKECDLATGQPVLGEDGKPRYMSYGTLTDLAKLLANVVRSLEDKVRVLSIHTGYYPSLSKHDHKR